MLVLYESSSICSEASFFEIREHVKEVNGCDEFDDRITEELEPFVVGHFRLGLTVFTESRHDTENRK